MQLVGNTGEEIIVAFTKEELLVIQAVLVCVAGDTEFSPRKHIDSFLYIMKTADIPKWDTSKEFELIYEEDADNGISFRDYPQ